MSLVLNSSKPVNQADFQYAWCDTPKAVYPYTIVVSFKTSDLTQGGSNAYIVSNDQGFTSNQNLSILAAAPPHILTASSYAGVWKSAVSTTYPKENTWHTLVVVFESSTSRRVYLDGGGKGVNTELQNAAVNVNFFTIGVRFQQAPNSYFEGKVAETAFYGIAFSDSDALLTTTTTLDKIHPDDLLAYYPLISDAQDHSGNGHHLTLKNNPPFDPNDTPFHENVYADLSSSTRLTDMPVKKSRHGFAQIGGILYAVCGLDETDTVTKTVYAYDTALGTWSKKADAPKALQSPVLRAVNGKLYLIGGYDSTAKFADVSEYDPGEDKWTSKTSMPTPRGDMASGVVGNKIYIFGGITTSNVLVSAVEIYDIVDDSWDTAATAMPTPRALGDFGAHFTSEGKIYIVSGVDDMSNYPLFTPTTLVEEYDPVSDGWVTKSSVKEGRANLEYEELNGYIYGFSGASEGEAIGNYYKTDEVYDIAANAWVNRPNTMFASLGNGVTKYEEDLYVCGGVDNDTGLSVVNLYKITPTALAVTGGHATLLNYSPSEEGRIYAAFDLNLDFGDDRIG
jgi:N-acetylneuraminic acid mutarotase